MYSRPRLPFALHVYGCVVTGTYCRNVVVEGIGDACRPSPLEHARPAPAEAGLWAHRARRDALARGTHGFGTLEVEEKTEQELTFNHCRSRQTVQCLTDLEHGQRSILIVARWFGVDSIFRVLDTIRGRVLDSYVRVF